MIIESKKITIEDTNVALQRCLFIGSIAASAIEGEFGYQFFGRDASAVADHYLDTNPNLAADVLIRLPEEQGDKYDWRTDEQPGRMPHQVAYNIWGEGTDRIELGPDVVADHKKWADRWGVPFDNKKGFVILNETDGIFYIHVLRKFVDRYGPSIRGEAIKHKSGKPRTVDEAALYKMDWMVRSIEESDAGLFEVAESNPRQTSWSGVRNDGYDAHFHPTGTIGTLLPHKIEYYGHDYPGMGGYNYVSTRSSYPDMYPGCKVNKDRPIAYFSNQVLAVQVLSDAITLFEAEAESDPKIRRRVKKWEELLHELPQNTFERFRWDEHNTFFPALDRSRDGTIRPVKLQSSTIAETLRWKEMYNRIGASDKTVRIGDIVGGVLLHALSGNFMTSAGVTMLHKGYTDYEDHVTYQGGAAIWGVEQEEIATSADAWGVYEPAYDLRNEHFIPSLEKAQEGGDDFPEYLVRSGDDIGYVCKEELATYPERSNIDFTIAAEQRRSKGQAWTISGAHHALQAMKHGRRRSSGWQQDVNKGFQKARSHIVPASQDKNRAYYVDLEQGKRKAARRISRMGELDPPKRRWPRFIEK
jgi:hypothetical protein